MRKQTGFLVVAALFAAFTFSTPPSALADTFGSGSNSVTIDFTAIGNPGNAADTTGFPNPAGAVDYNYRMAIYEVDEAMISGANALSGLNITFVPRGGNKPATGVSWNEAARFINWLNISSGFSPAYKFSLQPGDAGYSSNANIELWQAGDLGYNPDNLFRNANAVYFLPTKDEWYKAAFYDPNSTAYFDFATGSDAVPAAVAGGTSSGTAVYYYQSGPADAIEAGGFSPYGTMAQSGNVWEWNENNGGGGNSDPTGSRMMRGGSWADTSYSLSVNSRWVAAMAPMENEDFGFRVASVPEPSTYALLLMAAAGALWFTRKRRPIKVRALIPVVAVLFAAFTLNPKLHAQLLVNIETVMVGDPGNAADTNTRGLGAVAYEFNIGKYEVTIGQYTTFLNAVAATDTYSLYNPFMATHLNIAGIARAGSSGSFSYSALGSPNRPITYVSWFDAARFANWMNNGATVGASTETGAYTLSGANSGVITKNPGASWWIPSEDEWYKSAYYKSGGTDAGYWVYPTQSDSAPGNVVGGAPNQANYKRTSNSPTYGNTYLFSVTQSSSYSGSQNYLTDAGAFSGSASAYGTYDQGGNLEEWNDKIISTNKRGIRGGTWSDGSGSLLPAAYGGDDAYSGVSSNSDNSNYGFRMATVPEPSTYALLLMTAAGALWMTRRRR